MFNELPEEDLNKMHWKDRWEYEASKTKHEFRQLTEEDLLKILKEGRRDSYYQLWSAFGEMGTIKNSALPLFEFIKNHPGDGLMLDRYHCSTALFKILGLDPESELKKSVQWDHNGEEKRQEALKELEKIINEKQN